MRVNISATVSLDAIVFSVNLLGFYFFFGSSPAPAGRLPAGFNDTRQLPLGGKVSKADTANSEFPDKTPRAAAHRAAVVSPYIEFRLRLGLVH
jgi:hypothetical protein